MEVKYYNTSFKLDTLPLDAIHVIDDYHSEIYMIIVLDYLILDYFFENKFLMNSLKIDSNDLSMGLR